VLARGARVHQNASKMSILPQMVARRRLDNELEGSCVDQDVVELVDDECARLMIT
jgi:hypothetical protein